MYRRRGRGVAISLYDPLPKISKKPAPVYKNIVAMAVKVNEYLVQNPQRTYTSAGTHFGITRARISQLTKIANNLPVQLLKKLSETNDPALLKKYSGRSLLKMASSNKKISTLVVRKKE